MDLSREWVSLGVTSGDQVSVIYLQLRQHRTTPGSESLRIYGKSVRTFSNKKEIYSFMTTYVVVRVLSIRN